MPNRKYNCPENVTKKEKLLPKTVVSKRAELEQLRVPSSLMNRSNEITKPSAATASSKLRNAMRQITVAEDKTNSQRGYTDVGEGCSGWTPELDYESDINRRSVADITQDDVPEPRNKHRIPRLTQKTGCTDVGEGCSGWTPESDCLSDTSGRSLSDIAQTNVPKSRNVHRVPRPAGATAFEKQVLTDLKRLRFDQNEHGELLHKLFDALIRDKGPVGINNNKENVEKVLPDFPLLTVHDFHDLEKLLGTNKTAVSELENFCYGRGGADAASGVRRILAKVFDNSLALRVSWMGFRNNEKLEGTHFAKILFACIKNRYKRSNDRDIETAIINWFRRAGGRVAKEADSD